MNIKNNRFTIAMLVIAGFFFVSSLGFLNFVHTSPVSAQSTDCSKKANPGDCTKKTVSQCYNVSSADAKDRCIQDVAKAIKDKPGATGSAASASGSNDTSTAAGTHACGKGDTVVKTKFDFGCLGNSYGGQQLNPIYDLVFSLIRFLSIGVGLAVVASIVVAGIQYSSSEGNPEATQQAKNRIRSAIVGLFIYLFAFAIIQFLVPGGAFA